MHKRLLVFILVALLQWFVPGLMIFKYESTLLSGKIFRFEIAPVDPYDALRGRYLWLSFKENTLQERADLKVTRGQYIYVMLKTDDHEFARFSDYALEPSRGKNYLKLQVQYNYNGKIGVEIPFRKYFVNETSASKAEIIYNRGARADSKSEAYVLVRVKNGNAVIEELYINGKPLPELIKAEMLQAQ